MARLFLQVKNDMCQCGHRAQYVVAGYMTKKRQVLKQKVIGYDCVCRQIPIDIPIVLNTPNKIPSY